MNREINYILQAAMLLAVIGTSTWLIGRIPMEKTSTEQTTSLPPKISITPEKAALISKGKMIFYSNCASCHNLFKDGTGPSLAMTITQEQWENMDKLLAWINDPVAFMKTDQYTRDLKAKYRSVMPAFPLITRNDVDAILAYIEYSRVSY